MTIRTTLIAIIAAIAAAPCAVAHAGVLHDTTGVARHGAVAGSSNRDWLVAELPAAADVATSSTTGAMPALGLYRANALGAIGLRMRAGAMHHAAAGTSAMSPSALAVLGTAGVALRLGGEGGWCEVVFGVAATRHDIGPEVEVGAGWRFALGGIELGPSVRYLRIDDADPVVGSRDLVLVGADVYFGSHAARSPSVGTELASAPSHDAVTNAGPACVHDGSHCAPQLAIAVDTGRVLLGNDRITFARRSLFVPGLARMRPTGRELLAAIVTRLDGQPSWRRIRIASVHHGAGISPDDRALERRRVAMVRAALIQLGVSPERIEVGDAADQACRPIESGQAGDQVVIEPAAAARCRTGVAELAVPGR